MQIFNRTPFQCLPFESRGVDGRPFVVVVVKGRFLVRRDGRLERRIAGVRKTDTFLAEPGSSSKMVESDLVPFKPRADIAVHAVARTTAPRTHWVAGFRVGQLEHRLRVTGRRFWTKRDRGWELGEPEPCTSVPIVYERAFGGRGCASNPLGVGFLDAGAEPEGDVWEAPQIETLERRVTHWSDAPPPAGWLPLYRGWSPRTERAGTRDEVWRLTRCPGLPEDFDWAFCNGAHPDLVYPGLLHGDEPVAWWGLGADPVETRLPGRRIAVAMRLEGGGALVGSTWIDTLFIDVETMSLELTWRAILPKRRTRQIVVELVDGAGKG